MLNQAVLSLESDKVRLQPGDESHVKLGCADTPESFPRKALLRTKLPVAELLSVILVSLLKKNFSLLKITMSILHCQYLDCLLVSSQGTY